MPTRAYIMYHEPVVTVVAPSPMQYLGITWQVLQMLQILGQQVLASKVPRSGTIISPCNRHPELGGP